MMPAPQIAADQPQHPVVLDPLGQLPHQDVVIDPVKELLQVHVHHPAPAFLDERCADAPRRGRFVRAETRSCVGRSPGRIRLQHLQQRLLDEPVQHGRDAQLALPAARLGNLHPLHRLRLVTSREQLLPKSLPVLPQVAPAAHPPSSRPRRDCLCSSLTRCKRSLKVRAAQDPLHQRARSRASGFARRRRHFLAPRCLRGLHPRPPAGAPVARTSEAIALPRLTAVSLFSPFGPSPPCAATTASADFSLPGLQPRRPFRRKARSPQIRTLTFPARPPDLRRLSLVTRASRSLARSPCSASPHIRFLFVGPRFRSTLPSDGRSPCRPCGSLRSL